MQRICDVCGHDFEAKRRDAKTCSATCRSNKRNTSAPPDADETGGYSLVDAIRSELEAAGKLNTSLGQLALVLARRISGETTGVAALSKELSRVTAAAIGSSTPGASESDGDYIDELRKRRDAKKAV